MPRFLCDAAKGVLDALAARGASFDVPFMEFQDSVPADALGLHPGDELLRQVTVSAGLVDIAGVTHPVLVFSGQGRRGPLPRWYFPGGDGQLLGVADLVRRSAELAISRAGGEPEEVVAS